MTLTEMHEVDKNIRAGDDSMLKEIADQVDELNQLVKSKDITEAEYKELMSDLEHQQFIDAECKDLEGKAALAQLFDWAKTGASIIL